MDRLFAFARMDAIESQIKALEDEYRAIYQILAGEYCMESAIYKICDECGKELPYSEFYSRIRRGNKMYNRKCKGCEKVHRLTQQGKREKVGSQLTNPRTKKPKFKRNYELINDTQNDAAANGMSYGKWVAEQYLKEQRNEKEKRQSV